MDPEHAVPFDYTSVTPGDVAAGVDAAIARAESLVGAIAAVPDAGRSVENTLHPLDEISDLLTQAGGRYGFLAQVSPDAALREAAHAGEEQIDTFATGLGFREELDTALRALDGASQDRAMGPEAARFLDFELRDFRRNGMRLATPERRRLQELKERLVRLGIAFRRNIDEYEDAIVVSRAQLDGLPEAYIGGLTTQPGGGETRYRVSLDYPDLIPFLENAHDGALREELFRKNHNKAADVNVPILEEAIGLRAEIASILDYPSWADYRTEVRVARSPGFVLDFLTNLEARVRPKAESDLAALRALNGGDCDIWDWRYLTQRLRREQYDVDAFEVAEYFPLDAVLEGLFAVYEGLTGVRFLSHPDAGAWHPDVRFFDIADQASGEVVGHFYMDLHPRPGKFGHAAAFTLQGGRMAPGGEGYQRPVSAIVANFTKPTAAAPSLLQHSEVVTLFHEFGHILHQTLTRARYLRFSGTSVERDFVEAPSQMLEHWCWQPEVLRGFTRHHRTGDPIPEDLVRRMVAAKNAGSGIATLRQIYFSRLDMAYHGPRPAGAGAAIDTDAVARELHAITGFPFPEETHFQAGFGHLFGYDAGYYGYLWSKVSGDDMFTRFAEAGLPAPEVGRAYRRGILEPGGTRDGDALVRDFLGREPSPAAFLRDLGLDPEAPA
jgi:Zn-dependent oligopeptidase